MNNIKICNTIKVNYIFNLNLVKLRSVFMRVPKHIGIIPDGNRRWAENNGLSKEKGYNICINPGLLLFKLCQKLGIEELTYYGFTTDNTKRPKD